MDKGSGGVTIIVGGGIAGLAVSLLLSAKGQQVFLVEREPYVGGLWRTVTTSQGERFTLGTHIPELSGNADVDEHLFGELQESQWHRFTTPLHEGHLFQARLNDEGGCPDITHLPYESFLKGFYELIHARPSAEATYPDLQAQLNDIYGPTLTEQLFRPAMRKFLGQELENLAPDTHRPFIPQRLRVADRALTQELKKSEVLSQRIAHAGWRDVGERLGRTYLYPVQGECGVWIDQMASNAKRQGASILTGKEITRLCLEDGRIRSAVLNDGTALPCDRMIWTVAPALFLRAAGATFPPSPPVFRDLAVCHFTVDGEIGSRNFYVTHFDADALMFRTTFHNNITAGTPLPSPHRISVEVITGPGSLTSLQDILPRVREELYTFGLISQDARILYEGGEYHRNIFPVLSPDQTSVTKATIEQAQGLAKNVVFTGRAAQEGYFLSQLLPKLANFLEPVPECAESRC